MGAAKAAPASAAVVEAPVVKPTWKGNQTAGRVAPTTPTPTTAPPATITPAPAKVNCDPPFYFEGAKKVFKPECL